MPERASPGGPAFGLRPGGGLQRVQGMRLMGSTATPTPAPAFAVTEASTPTPTPTPTATPATGIPPSAGSGPMAASTSGVDETIMGHRLLAPSCLVPLLLLLFLLIGLFLALLRRLRRRAAQRRIQAGDAWGRGTFA